MISIFDMLKTTLLSRSLFVAADKDIAEQLSLRSMSTQELAQAIKVNADSLYRLLYFLSLYDVFKQDNEGRWYNTDFSLTMCGDHEQSIKCFLLHDDETRWNSFGNLGYSITTNKDAFSYLYGESYFDYIKKNKKLGSRFDKAMEQISHSEDDIISSNFSFNGVVADIGGGTGQLLKLIIKKQQNTKGVLLDLPEVVCNIKESDFKVVGGSFFDPVTIQADTYILKRILHDWDDEKALSIIKNICSAMKPDSTLYIIEGILDEAIDKKLLAAIDLALLTIFQGKERTKKDFEALISASGLKISSIKSINSLISIIECKKEI